MFRSARIGSSLFAMLTLASACDNKEKASSTSTSASHPSATTTSVVAATVSGTTAASVTPATGDAAAPPAATKEPVMTVKGVGLATPESVIHDYAADVYIASNINGTPLAVDNNGFISRISPDGKIEALKWIEGGKNKVTLNAPKGLALLGESLYVADLDTVRIFDRKTGAPEGEVKIPGATFLNDVAVTSDGHVLVSDSALKAGAKGFEPTGTDAVWSIDKAKKATPLAKSKDLGGPNGLLPAGDKTWVVTFGSGEMYTLDAKGKKADAKKLPKGALDGIVMLPDGDVLVSSWEAGAVYRGKPGGELTAVVENVKSPSDIGFDQKRHRVLIPLFESDEIRAYQVAR